MGQLLWSVAVGALRLRCSLGGVVTQMYVMGVQSLPIVIVTASLAGIVTSQQGGYQFTGSVPLYVLCSLVAETMVLEMGPVLTAIVLVGRIGARITAELGTMVVSEQIDAYHSLGRDPVAILVAPRILAGILVMPLLVAIADAVGIPGRDVRSQADDRARVRVVPLRGQAVSGTPGTWSIRSPRLWPSASPSR